MLGPRTLLIFLSKDYLINIKQVNLNPGGADMKTAIKETLSTQLIKKQRLDREFAWISREFKDFHTLSDVEIYNAERYAALHLGYSF